MNLQSLIEAVNATARWLYDKVVFLAGKKTNVPQFSLLTINTMGSDAMSFRVPNFNLECNIWHGLTFMGLPGVGVDPDIPLQECQLFLAKDLQAYFDFPGDTTPWDTVLPIAELRVPALVDIRDKRSGANFDTVEVPEGSGRYYSVVGVEDRHKGFTNEYRVALMVKIAWPHPAP